MEHIRGGLSNRRRVNGRAGIVQAYRTGRGKIYVRAKAVLKQTNLAATALYH